MRWRPPLELLILGAAACGRTGVGEANAPMVVAVVEVTDAAPITTGATAPASQGGRGGGPGCAFEVEVEEIVPSSPTCTIYEQLTRGDGRLMLPCGGADGEAIATFGEHEYRGEVRAKRLTLKHSYEFQEKDGCMWRVSGKIVGTPASGKLAWSYSEEILEDETTNCWATCTAHTGIRITPVR